LPELSAVLYAAPLVGGALRRLPHALASVRGRAASRRAARRHHAPGALSRLSPAHAPARADAGAMPGLPRILAGARRGAARRAARTPGRR